MAPLTVDPTALDSSGAAVVAAGENLGSVTSTLTSALGGLAGMAGDDPAGAQFGRAYDQTAATVLQAMAVTRNGLSNLGDGVRMTAHNYSLAEAMSDVAGRAASLPVPKSTSCVAAASAPSAIGNGDSAPPGWGWVAPYIGMIWPNGDSGKLRAAAAAWRNAGAQFAVAEIHATAGPMAAIRAQQLPEAGLIEEAFSDAYSSTTAIVGQCQTIATGLEKYAAHIDSVHAAILDLLSRICDPLTGIKEVWEFLTDEDEDEIARIAHDIAMVVDNFSAEVDAFGNEVGTALAQAKETITTMGRHAAREWNQFLHGNPVGQVIDFAGQRLKGLGKAGAGMVETALRYNQIRALLDPVGYGRDVGGMALGMAPLVGLGDEHAPSVAESWRQFGKQFVHWDDWAKNPGEALGETEADIGTLFLPGGAFSKLTNKGRDIADAVGALKERWPWTREPIDPNPPKPFTTTDPKTARPEPGQPPPHEQPKAGSPAPSPQPKPGPEGASLPHSPTESKTPVETKPATGEPAKPAETPPASAGQARAASATGTGDQLPRTHSQSSEPLPAQASASPGEMPTKPASAGARPPQVVSAATAHAPTGQALSSEQPTQLEPLGAKPSADTPNGGPTGSHPSEIPHDEPASRGYTPQDQPSDGVTTHGPRTDDPPPESHPSGDASTPENSAADHSPSHATPSELPWYRLQQLELAQSPERLVRDLLDRGCPRDIAESASHSPYAGMSLQELIDAYWDSGNRTWKWPLHDGFADGKWEVAHSIPEQLTLDRIGEVSAERGDFMGNVGDSYPQRALAPGTTGDYHIFKGTGKTLPEGWELRFGSVAAEFGQPGGGTQWVVVDEKGQKVLIEVLLRRGYLSPG
ncbi:Outer membrane channel protein CpnT [Mycobacterium attenuatum]|uniref:Outer membrane channel protein CpnT n=1 Tax=Mycobacterium attenuatum TaxID=2341086 RepID=A0A498QIF7_9MYCO|nr:TNT domain-containing protein [Mycobacterium attenuatum]VBA44285.1 Outer membrane channel protein CpnT [Mycobacterium attenuatum]